MAGSMISVKHKSTLSLTDAEDLQIRGLFILVHVFLPRERVCMFATWSVCSSHNEDLFSRLQTVHLGQQLIYNPNTGSTLNFKVTTDIMAFTETNTAKNSTFETLFYVRKRRNSDGDNDDSKDECDRNVLTGWHDVRG